MTPRCGILISRLQTAVLFRITVSYARTHTRPMMQKEKPADGSSAIPGPPTLLKKRILITVLSTLTF